MESFFIPDREYSDQHGIHPSVPRSVDESLFTR